jgi:hypothetical protein
MILNKKPTSLAGNGKGILKNRLRKQDESKARSGFIGNKFKGLDIYGESVSLTYKGDSVYKTKFGAFITFIIYLTVISFGAYRTIRLFKRINPDMATLNFMRDLSEAEAINAEDLGFDFAFRTWNEFDETIGTLTFNHVHYKYIIDEETGERDRVKIKTALGAEPCTLDGFNFPEKDKLDVISIHKFLCPQIKMY